MEPWEVWKQKEIIVTGKDTKRNIFDIRLNAWFKVRLILNYIFYNHGTLFM
jgi:hypothetical protein